MMTSCVCFYHIFFPLSLPACFTTAPCCEHIWSLTGRGHRGITTETWCQKINLNWTKEVKPHLYFSHRLNTKNTHICFTNFFSRLNFLHNIFSKEAAISLLIMCRVSPVWFHFLLRSTNLSKSPILFPIISIVKLAKIWVLLQNSTQCRKTLKAFNWNCVKLHPTCCWQT